MLHAEWSMGMRLKDGFTIYFPDQQEGEQI